MADVIRITTTAENAAAMYDALDAYIHGRPERMAPNDPAREALVEVKDALGQPERAKRHARTLLDMGYPKPQKPERGSGGQHDDYTETHPAYAMIGASRVTGNAILAGSDFRHQSYMVIRIKRADVRRGNARDWWFAGGGEVVEVALSEAQWATFLSATNVGDGVPCTLQWTETDGPIAQIVPITDRREQMNDEVAQALSEAVAALDEILADPKSTKATREKAQRAKMRLTDSVPFVVKSADEHIENTVERAKIEVHAYMTGAIQRAGLQALGADGPISGFIESGVEGDE